MRARQRRTLTWEYSKGDVRNTKDESNPAVLVTSTDASSDLPAWSRFRGPNGTGICSDAAVPIEWGDSKNLKWKAALPGLGSSSPVLTDKFLFVTCYSGYGEDRSGGDMRQLKRHVVCVRRDDGSIAWTKTIAAADSDDRYEGMGVPEHGYATNTPVTDGKHLFAFLGKSGVYAYDMDGNELWHTEVGKESGNRRWGTAASLILVDNLVIVNASEESQAVIALDKSTGKEVWKAPASTLELAYGTPALCRVDDSRTDLVLAVPGEVWGLNPKTGKLVWFVETKLTGNLSPSVIVDGDRIYAFGGYRSAGSVAIKAGGKGDVTGSHALWTSSGTSYVSTPVLVDGKFYWIDDKGMYFCQDASDGKIVERSRVSGLSGGRPVYASSIAVGGNILIQSRNDGVFVLAAQPKLKIVHQNRFESDTSMSNATPAVDRGAIYLRTNQALYCVSQ
ncbi:MAG: PQQ-binding-like beta-propeller repeat protein [Pirellulales bacterium]